MHDVAVIGGGAAAHGAALYAMQDAPYTRVRIGELINPTA